MYQIVYCPIFFVPGAKLILKKLLGSAQWTSGGKVKYIRVETQGQQDAHNISLYSTQIITRDFADLPELIILALKGHNSQSVSTARQ